MTDSYAYSRLPPELLATATERGGEMAWDVDDIPRVIEAAARAGLVNLGGQLQFRIPDGGTCEVPWVEVNTHNAAPPSLAWDIRVQKAAQAALDDFDALRTRVDFLQEGLRGFPDQLREYEAKGGKAEAALCFVWYVVRKRA